MKSAEELVCEIVEPPDRAGITLPQAELDFAQTMKSPKRREEFLLGRAAAHRALQKLDAKTEDPILRGSHGEPVWPRGIIGSIAHTGAVGVAVAGRAENFVGLGVDIELSSRVISPGVQNKITLPAERIWIDEDPSLTKIRTLEVFCAKESIYKAYFPICRKPMSFKDAFVRWEDEHQAFIGTLLTDLNEEHRAGDLLLIHCVTNEKYTMCCSILPAESEAEVH